MAVDNQTIFAIGLMAMIYLFLWRRDENDPMWIPKRVVADILFFVCGMGTYMIITTGQPWGILISVLALIDVLYTVFR